MNEQKKDFLKNELVPMLSKLEPSAKGKWGVMDAQQMVEHLSEFIRIASGREKRAALYPPDVTQKMHTFMMSEKPFRENTPNQLLPDVPPSWKNKDMAGALNELKDEISHFISTYEAAPALRVLNPFFGDLDYEEQVQLLHKHTTHHCRQFGLM
jgi:hypothetical protein